MIARTALAEFIGTAFLVAGIVGSGVAASRLSNDAAVQLLCNSLATGLILVALITALRPVSSSFNPVVTVLERVLGRLDLRTCAVHVSAQIAGGLLGCLLANAMFAEPLVAVASTDRASVGAAMAEVIATVGLMVVVFSSVLNPRSNASGTGLAVGTYIGAAYWFTSSTSFANPAVTVARTVSDTFTGIAPTSAALFVAMQLIGGALALPLIRLLTPKLVGEPRA